MGDNKIREIRLIRENPRFRRYPEYKESGVEFIREMPKDWDAKRCAHLFEVKHVKKTSGEINLSVYRDYGVIKRDSRSDNHNRVSEDTSNYKLVEPGDFVFNKMKCWQGSLGISEYRGIVSPAYTVCKPKIPFHGKYFHYLLRSRLYIQEFNRLSYGVRIGQWELRFEDFKNIVAPYPSLSEQTQIANFLDRKTEQIDELIRIKEQQIALLHEQRTALINHAVTKGLDPNVEMKPSEVDWIGEIPAHWKIIRLRYLGALQNGISKNSDSFGLGYPFLSYGDVYNNETLPIQVEGLVKSTKADRERYSVLERDIFFTRTSETIGEIGISSTCMKTIENCVFSGFLIRFRNTSRVLTKEFSKYYFLSHLPRVFLAREVNIVTRSSLSQELLKRLPVLLPPIDEQREIAIFLDEQTKKIDSMIEKENKQIQLLKEYRQSLISEAVTGKIDVRNEV